MPSSSSIPPPDVRGILAPLLPSLPAAAASTEPAPAILPLLSPILRQRVQLLSSSSTEPWIRLLSYDTAKAAGLPAAVQGGGLEPHPVSGEVEVDWDYEVETRFRRLDQETLQAMVVLAELGLCFQLVYCVGDHVGGGDGWRIGEASVPDKPSPFASFGGKASISEAEAAYNESKLKPAATSGAKTNSVDGIHVSAERKDEEEEEDDDDDYWARYDATPARTPAVKRSPAPQSIRQPQDTANPYGMSAAEDAYFSQYDSVQPAMDNYDPEEEVELIQVAQPPLGRAWPAPTNSVEHHPQQQDEASASPCLAQPYPRPASSAASSSGAESVARLEAAADRKEQSEFGVKQHVSRSIRSLFLLSRASGIDRDEFERLVRTELDVLGMVEADI